LFFALHQRPRDNQELCRQLDFHLQLDAALELTALEQIAVVTPDVRVQ